MVKYNIPRRVAKRLKTLGKLISATRRERGFTQTELAERAGTSRPTINRIESGNPNVVWGTVMTVCWLLDLPTDPDLMDAVRRAELLSATNVKKRARGLQELDDDF
ncbi:MAG: helix-turn-helix transcriptional regulator [Gammaproteobacteria bacterium]|nr:helix-turn-helix transcriptional regulator [Gammaproteobacteria bacterium]